MSQDEGQAPEGAGAGDPPSARSKRISLPIVEEAQADTESALAAAPAPRFWRSIAEREGSTALAASASREFPTGASELNDVYRRSFMQLLGSSAALAGIAACQQPQQQAIPFIRRPEEVTPGLPLHFATAYSLEGFGNGLLVESHEGRPTKIEGNPDHHDSVGTARTFEQALLLGLYDDDRAKQIRHGATPKSWTTLLLEIGALATRHAADGGARLRFLTEPTTSPLHAELRQKILERFPKAKFTSFAPTAGDGSTDGLRAVYGRPLEARHDLYRATVIVSLDADFLGDGPQQLRLARQFAHRRTPDAEMNRLYVVEPGLSVTGNITYGASTASLTNSIVAQNQVGGHDR